MALSAATLASEFNNLSLYSDSASAAEDWAEAFTTYFEDAVTAPSGVGVVVAQLRGVGSPKEGLKSALLSITPGSAASDLETGLAAFWAPIIAAPATFFPGMILPASAPGGISGVGTTLQSTFDSNTSGSKSKSDCADLVAADIHSANSGGIVTKPGTPPTPETIT